MSFFLFGLVFNQYKKPPPKTTTNVGKNLSDFIVDTVEYSSSDKDELSPFDDDESSNADDDDSLNVDDDDSSNGDDDESSEHESSHCPQTNCLIVRRQIVSIRQ